jgi:hypothetical protein
MFAVDMKNFKLHKAAIAEGIPDLRSKLLVRNIFADEGAQAVVPHDLAVYRVLRVPGFQRIRWARIMTMGEVDPIV